MEPRTLLKAENVGVAFRQRIGFMRSRRFWAVQDVSFELRAGETLGVIGRNAAGKSTLLQVLAGIISPDRGKIRISATSASLLSLKAGFVKYLSGRENAVLSGLMLGMPLAAVKANLDNVKEFSELGDFFEQPVSTYSSGMVARLGFSAAMYFEPEILLIDEMLGVGDSDFKKKSSAAMREKLRSNLTVVLVSHSAGTLRALCNRAVWIEEGTTVREGAVDEVVDEYEAFMEKLHEAPDRKTRQALRSSIFQPS
ncbi:MAG: ABC transporter ATP-binding protein [Wenzhouxiangellaceae bacterium]